MVAMLMIAIMMMMMTNWERGRVDGAVPLWDQFTLCITARTPTRLVYVMFMMLIMMIMMILMIIVRILLRSVKLLQGPQHAFILFNVVVDIWCWWWCITASEHCGKHQKFSGKVRHWKIWKYWITNQFWHQGNSIAMRCAGIQHSILWGFENTIYELQRQGHTLCKTQMEVYWRLGDVTVAETDFKLISFLNMEDV